MLCAIKKIFFFFIAKMLSQREVTRRAPQRLDNNLTPNGAWNVQSTLWYNWLWYGIHRALPEVGLVASGDCSILVKL